MVFRTRVESALACQRGWMSSSRAMAFRLAALPARGVAQDLRTARGTGPASVFASTGRELGVIARYEEALAFPSVKIKPVRCLLRFASRQSRRIDRAF